MKVVRPISKKTDNIKFWNVAKDGENATIELFGEVVSETPWYASEDSQFVTPKAFQDDLDEIKGAKDVTIKFDSVGGDLYTGIGIYNALKGLDANKVGIVYGIAASAITAPLMACDVIRVHESSEIMVHSVSAVLSEASGYTSEDLDKLKKSVDASDKALATIYSNRTGKTVKECLALMKSETWMVGEEAVELGFADEVVPDEEEKKPEQENKIHAVAMVAGLKRDLYKAPIQSGNKPVENIAAESAEKEAEKPMTLKDFQEKYPEIVKEVEAKAAEKAVKEAQAEIAKKAVAEERARLQAIEEIANECSPELVNEAKYGDKPMTAEQLAFKALKENKEKGMKYMSDRAEELKATAKVESAPSEEKSAQDKQAEENARLSTLYAKMKGGRK